MSRVGNVIVVVGSCLCTVLFFALLPQMAHAAINEADLMCNPVKVECGCMQIMVKGKCVGGANMYLCPCFDVTSGMTAASGVCMAPTKCLANQAGGMMPMLPMIPMIPMSMEMPQDPCMQPTNTATTSTSSPATSPCPNGFGGYSGYGDVFDSSAYFNNTSGVDDSLSDALNPTEGGSTTTAAPPKKVEPVVPTTTSYLTGSIKVGEAGASILSNLRQGVAEVAGFFGGTSFGGAGGQSTAGRLCATRPWAKGGALAKLIPDAFFDSLCSKAGYQVGVTVPSPVTTVVQPKKPAPKAAATTTKAEPKKPVDLGPVEVNIWAEPASTRLGTRTYIFWTSKGVLDCTVTGPNFTQSTLSGGASTVPISGPTTYSLSCTKPDGTKETDTVTVRLAL